MAWEPCPGLTPPLASASAGKGEGLDGGHRRRTGVGWWEVGVVP